MYFGGIEGGATHSKLVICNENGEMVTSTTGLGTNHWMIGIAECSRRIADMVERAKIEVGIPLSTRMTSLGLSLSGCEQEATNKELEKELRTSHGDVADHYFVCSDTVGSIFTVSPLGGLVLISGTGSNALLRNPNGTSFGCGGWGNYLGDEGSAWWISHRALKIVFDDMDNFEKSLYPINRVWDLAKQHFSVESRLDLLDHCYAKFDKPFFANLCKKLAGAAEEGDELCKFLFKEAGRLLARSIHALLPKIEQSLVSAGNLRIVCVGSVWLSWNLLSEGFLTELNRLPISFGLQLVTINSSMAFGACYLGADSIKFALPRKYDDNYKSLYYYKQQHKTINGSTTTCNGNSKQNGGTNCVD